MSAPYILNQMGLVVLDEAQFITDPSRGIVVELLLTNLISARKRGIAPQLLTLSAVIGDTNSFDRWLGSGLLKTTDRPVPLTEGVLDRSGAWRFARPAGEVENARLLDGAAIQQRGREQSSQDILVPLVRQLVGQGEKVIVFRNARGRAAGCAEYLARELRLPAAQAIIDALPQSDLSTMSNRLRRSLAGGIAFHNGDLNRDERVAVERGFRDPGGGVYVLVATSTVAAGVNTPASTVVIVETSFPTAAGPQPYTVAQYKNMAGRAGRLGFETQGKAVVLAATSFERETLFRRYVQGQPEPIRSSFDAQDPGTWVVRLLAQVNEIRRDAVIDLVANTYGGYLAILRDPSWRNGMIVRLTQLLDRMQTDGLIEARGEQLSLSMLGRVCGESPLSLNSALQAVELIRLLTPKLATLETLLAMVEALPERDEDYTPQSKHGETGHQEEVATKWGSHVARMLRHRARSDREYYARCKRALIVAHWIDGVSSSDIEERYSSGAFNPLGHGDIRGFADGTRFLFEAMLRISAIVLGSSHPQDSITDLLRRLDLGIPTAALVLTRLQVVLSRGEILSFWRAGILTATQITEMTLSEMESLMGRRAKSLHRQFKGSA